MNKYDYSISFVCILLASLSCWILKSQVYWKISLWVWLCSFTLLFTSAEINYLSNKRLRHILIVALFNGFYHMPSFYSGGFVHCSHSSSQGWWPWQSAGGGWGLQHSTECRCRVWNSFEMPQRPVMSTRSSMRQIYKPVSCYCSFALRENCV